MAFKYEAEMVFRADEKPVVVKSPQELVTAGIIVHPDAVERVFGPGTGEQYVNAARIKQKLNKPTCSKL